ncbi:hypothetical protein PPL_10052 [Heterostelium album PN500]|uniref:Cathepsin propeptide inhibitor domain-containing protein n=1 Tax=Heterostelium pallidum (strain ATCC 26659 / Pp 5 / PN500) TaxID=670386 RepID=D3BQ69_HETP5|nr:hypothetical protein PPL_10052 [Heterostelium album PN500]EFA76289.1 hypothetical protein PPL_10052 [Heterostelium album PN500]|eukprot:XP_020428421.1 hypothetical protein PPL_10052 [Heterostelium album PN500]
MKLFLKSIFLFIVLLNFSKGSLSQEVPSDEVLFEAFNNWMINYDIHFTSGDMQSKFQSWKENAIDIAKRNEAISGGDMLLTYDEGAGGVQRTLLDAAPVVSYPNADTLKFSLNQFSDIPSSEFLSQYTGHIPNPSHAVIPAVAAASGLSAGAIAGIAVGGAAAVGLIIGGGIFGLKKAKIIGKKDTEEKRSIPSPIEMQTRASNVIPNEPEPVPFSSTTQEVKIIDPSEDPSSPVKGGINVFDHSKNPRHSITARDIRNWESTDINDNQQEDEKENEKHEYEDKL